MFRYRAYAARHDPDAAHCAAQVVPNTRTGLCDRIRLCLTYEISGSGPTVGESPAY